MIKKVISTYKTFNEWVKNIWNQFSTDIVPGLSIGVLLGIIAFISKLFRSKN